MLPRIDGLFDKMKGAKVFSNMDLRSGYQQLRKKEEDIPNTAFKMWFGNHEFIVVPFGLKNVLGVFMSLMDGVLQQYPDNLIQVYLDEILIYFGTLEEHKEYIK